MKKEVKILDCTLRDGGYYTNWDFDKQLVDEYYKAMEILPIDYVEIGYRSIPLNRYLGEYFYCPEYVMEKAKRMMPSKKLAIILDEKTTKIEDLDYLLDPCKPFISMVRMAIAPNKLINAINIAKVIKAKGFEVGFNIMYMSNWKEDKEFLNQLDKVNDIADVFYMVDSYGGVLPKDIEEIFSLVSSKLDIPVAFHGHNNLELAHINTLTAIESGCLMVDATITGMGRGAGNLKTELLLTYFSAKEDLKLSMNELSSVVSNFEKLQQVYKWGTSLPYMFSGVYSLPQKEVMEWIGLNRYPLGSIVNALKNQKDSISDNLKLPSFNTELDCKFAIIIGGGKSIQYHHDAIERFIETSENVCVIHAGARYISLFNDLTNAKQFYCLVGSEIYKLSKEFHNLKEISNTCIFPPFPRKMGTIIPDELKDRSFELEKISFIDEYQDSPLAIALEVALQLKSNEIVLAGFDGYDTSINRIQFQLSNENQQIIDSFEKNCSTLKSCTPTKYKNIKEVSIYSSL
ncbi:aldolase catalytic domain-containing protein [Ascidiimonas aurantiaca]|uniref:aldolase catalytic domain-containing protein n=1 Tax=Ascidiimonas aurantiaca TaxID=1685432 RepID=UPI0030EE7ED8